MKNQVLVSDIQKFAANDGPGFRTLVFLKGCPLQCTWCHNPETKASTPEIYWKSRLCVQCGACLEVCPNNAILPPTPPHVARSKDSTYHKIVRDRCDGCMACVDACQYDALTVAGKSITVDEILDEVEKDRPFYNNSGGGLTLSGGEPTFHADFAMQILKSAKERGIHVCLDTNGFCEWEVLRKMVETVDIVLFDLKHMDSAIHKQYTGVGNEKILDNLRRLLEIGADTWVRIPVIPGFNDSKAFHECASEFLSNIKGQISRVDLLPFHNWCQDKYRWLGIDWALKDTEAIEPSFLEIPADIYREKGLVTTVGGSGFENTGSAVGW
ncbi:MAG: glycyl-radical enzyme activating protein [Desulfobacteraceae bacterium]|jgi:pyruvate formate lyase activating enzyme|nr:glycyl-radical enzyme activating protein [Desulfobacteraceae bacterium]